jgi:hypothetical protein
LAALSTEIAVAREEIASPRAIDDRWRTGEALFRKLNAPSLPANAAVGAAIARWGTVEAADDPGESASLTENAPPPPTEKA